MQYISISLYRKMVSCALNEGMSKDDFDWLALQLSLYCHKSQYV